MVPSVKGYRVAGHVCPGIGEYLPGGGSGGATIWVLNLVVDGNNYVKTRGHTCGFPAAGDGGKGVKAGGRDLAEGGGG